MISVYKFMTKSCSQCKMADMVMKHFTHPVIEIDCDKNMDLAQKYSIIGLPTYIVMKVVNGEDMEVGRISGYTPNLMGRILDIIENA